MGTGEFPHGRYLIKARMTGDAAMARAFMRAAKLGVIAEARASTIDEAVDAVRRALDTRDAERTKARRYDEAMKFFVPSVADYAEALKAVKPGGGHLRMLQAHAMAGDVGLTAEGLAGAAGYADHSAANLQYGLLGQDFADYLQLGMPSSVLRAGMNVATGVLAGAGEPDERGRFVWVMHPELREALREIGV